MYDSEPVMEAVLQAFGRRLDSHRYRRGELITLPMSLGNGNLIQVYVEQVDAERFLVSDLGQAAFELATAGVSLEPGRAAGRSWELIVKNLSLDPPLLVEQADDYQLVGTSVPNRVGESVLELAEAVLRADALRGLAPSRRGRRFRDTIVAAAGRANLHVLPDAPMPTKHGGLRRVSLAVYPADQGAPEIFIQAVGQRSSSIEGFDKAQAVLTSASLPTDRLVAALADGLRLETWQIETLRDHGTAIMERDLDAFMTNLAS